MNNSTIGYRIFWKSLLAGALLILMPQLAAPQNIAVQQRIIAPIDENNRTVLRGNTHPLARPQSDQGAAADSQPMRRMLLLLQRGPDQEAALRNLLDDQQSAASLRYRQWLTPQQFGEQFGPADADVQTVTNWLASHGFQINRVSAGKTAIEFSGNAGQVRDAFQTEIHKYLVNGEQHLANASDPQIPAALVPLVAGTVSLHNFPRKSQSRIAGVFSRSNATGTVKPLDALNNQTQKRNSATPAFNFPSSSCPVSDTCFALGPTDFATIYNLLPLWTNNITGTGQTIAIIGDSEICTANSPDFEKSFIGPFGELVYCNSDDVATFRSLFGLPQTSPNVIVDGPDPGFNADETEGDLDVEWSGAIAKNATIDFVIAEDTEASPGVDLAALYAVDNNLAAVISESFGDCEAFLGNGGNQFYRELWEQAAAQGITVVVAAGDNGSAGCDNPDLSFPTAAQDGLAVNGIASTPYNVAAGGTDFDITLPSSSGYANTFWGSSNGANEQSAKSYIPETTWNDSCAQSFTSSLKGCNLPALDGLNIVGGGGGQSSCVTSHGVSCTSAYTKPAWQGGPYVTGTASTDAVRDIPDISFFAADGLISGSFYIVCESDLDTSSAPCSLSAPSYFTTFIGVGGTSSSAPTFAGIMAMLNQQMTALHGANPLIPVRQGNANYVLYALANKQQTSGLSCSSSAGPNALCTFNDVTKGNNSVACFLASPNCNAANPSPYGSLETETSNGGLTGVSAFDAGIGYDLATGLGTINATNLVNNWSSVAGSFSPTTTTLRLCGPATTCTPSTAPVTTTHGQTINISASVTSALGTPTGEVSLLGTGAEGGIDFGTLSGGSTSGQVNSFPGGTYSVTAHYTGDGTFGASDSTPAISVTINPEASTTTVTVPVLNFVNGTIAKTLASPGGGTVDFGDATFLRADVVGASGQENATGTVTFKDGTTTLGIVQLNAQGYAELQTGANTGGAPITPLAIGSHSITATYNGDVSYNGSTTASAVPVSVVAAPTTITLQVSAINIPPSSSITVSPNSTPEVNAFIDTKNIGNPSGGSFGNFYKGTELAGTVTFTSGTTTLGTSLAVPANSKVDSDGFIAAAVNFDFTPTTAETLTINATFTPSNANYLPSSVTAGATVNVANNEGFTIMPASALNFNCLDNFAGTCVSVPSPGQTVTTPVTVSSIGLNGTVALTCAVSPSNPNDQHLPTCSFTFNGSANSTVTLSGNGTIGQRLLNITTTANSALPVSTYRPQCLDWILTGTAFTLACCFFLLLIVPKRKQPSFAVFALLLISITGVAIGCGGGGGSSGAGSGGSGGGSGGGGTNTPGTTADIYTVTVTATPSSGTALQTQFLIFVQ